MRLQWGQPGGLGEGQGWGEVLGQDGALAGWGPPVISDPQGWRTGQEGLGDGT